MAGAIKRKNENGGARQELDKFYTKDDVALSCIKTILPLIDRSDIVVEPGAGGGSFNRQIKHNNLQAYDLEPESEGIVKFNWFEMTREVIGNGSLLVIGNPPFGVRSDLAKGFIRKSISLGAETIAFILPKTFSKALNQQANLFPKEFRLVIENELDDNSFTLEGETFHIPCGWYVWTKNNDFMEGINLRKKLLAENKDFKFVSRGSTDADFTINGNNGKIKSLNEVTNPKAEHYIRVNNRKEVLKVKNKLLDNKYDFKSSVNGGVAWIGKQEIIAAYENQISKDKG